MIRCNSCTLFWLRLRIYYFRPKNHFLSSNRLSILGLALSRLFYSSFIKRELASMVKVVRCSCLIQRWMRTITFT